MCCNCGVSSSYSEVCVCVVSVSTFSFVPLCLLGLSYSQSGTKVREASPTRALVLGGHLRTVRVKDPAASVAAASELPTCSSLQNREAGERS
jgi:hypothetical protein